MNFKLSSNFAAENIYKNDFINRVKNINKQLNYGKTRTEYQKNADNNYYSCNNPYFKTKLFYNYYNNLGYNLKVMHTNRCEMPNFLDRFNNFTLINPFLMKPYCDPFDDYCGEIESVIPLELEKLINNLQGTLQREILDSIEPPREANIVAKNLLEKTQKDILTSFFYTFDFEMKKIHKECIIREYNIRVEVPHFVDNSTIEIIKRELFRLGYKIITVKQHIPESIHISIMPLINNSDL